MFLRENIFKELPGLVRFSDFLMGSRYLEAVNGDKNPQAKTATGDFREKRSKYFLGFLENRIFMNIPRLLGGSE